MATALNPATLPSPYGYKWIAAFGGGPVRAVHDSVLIGDIIYIFGGCRLDDPAIEHEPIEIQIVHVETFHWKILGPPRQPPEEAPFMRHDHTVVEHGGYAYLFGGRNSRSYCNKLFRYDPRTHRWQTMETIGITPNPIYGHSMTVVKDKAYVYGGVDTSIDPRGSCSERIYCLNFGNFSWSEVSINGTPPNPRYYHTACVINRKIYIFGGVHEASRGRYRLLYHSNDVHMIDLDCLVWRRAPRRGPMPPARRSHSAFVYRGLMYIYGGYDDIVNRCHGDMRRFDPINATWESIPIHVGAVKIPPSRRCHTTTVAGDRIFLIGGATIAELGLDFVGCAEKEYRDQDVTYAPKNFFVLDMKPSLKILCTLTAIRNELDRTELPATLQTLMQRMLTTGEQASGRLQPREHSREGARGESPQPLEREE